MVLSAFSQGCRQILSRWHRASRRRPRPGRASRPLAVESLETRAVPAGTWTTLARLAPEAIGTMLLLSDGTVMAQGGGSAATRNQWHRLTPNASGSYVAGTWSNLASMSLQRLYYGSSVLPDGRVFVVGGEYSGPQDQRADDTNTGEIYDPVANSWSPIPDFPQTHFGDNSTEVLPDGRILAGYLSGPQTYIFDPATNSWTPTGSKLRNDRSSEENWVKLTDGSILSYDIYNLGHAQRYVYNPSTGAGQWVDTGTVPVALSGPTYGSELGPGVLLPDGRAWFTGATGHTAFYTLSTNTWAAGPDLPNGLVTDDAPGAVLPNGHVLIAADTLLYRGPTHLFDFDPGTNSYTDVTPPSSIINTSGAAYLERMLVLPTGQVLLATYTNKLAVYTPDGDPIDSAKPTISSITANADGSFTLAGTQLNGAGEGAGYGDDAQMASNYPIVRLTGADGSVYYARTSNWSSTGVATGDTPVTTQFTVPANLPAGSYSLVVVANGIASDAVPFGSLPAAQLSVVASSDTVTAGTPFTVTVTALDANGNPVPDYQGTVHFRSNDPQAVLPRRYTFTAADAGVHTFTVTLTTAGTRNIVVRDTAIHSIKGKATVTVTSAPAVAYQILAPSSVVAGMPFDITVIAVDPYGNTDTSFLGTISFSTSDPATLLPADYTLRPSDQGMATFEGFVLVTPGDQTMTVTDPASGITGSVTITVLPG
jgi:hypothetical protein